MENQQNSTNNDNRSGIEERQNDNRNKNRSKLSRMWPSSSIVNLINSNRNRNNSVYEFVSTEPETVTTPENALVLAAEIPGIDRVKKNKGKHAIVSIVLVEAKGLPKPPEDGSSHVLYCKIRLGSETYKSKSVNTQKPEWRERFKLRLGNENMLSVSLWDKGKQKNFMGSCVLDLSLLEKERTHEIWQLLDDGYGSIHLSVTVCMVDNNTDYGTTAEQEKYSLSNLRNWKLVGQLHVKLIAAKGLSGKPNAYCVLELDNERVQTPFVPGPEHLWNRTYVFNVYDVTSTLDLKVHDSSLMNSFLSESLGKISIPLLRACNGEARWYALKDKNKRNSAKGNCPRILLELNLIWNPLKASLKLFQPKEVKYIKKSHKFDVFLVYRNIEFVRDTFILLYDVNESFKRLFEWDNQELSAIALCLWLVFWYHFKFWTLPLLLLGPFIYFWAFNRRQQEMSFMRKYSPSNDPSELESPQNEKTFTGRIQGLPDMTLTITNGIEYMASIAERLYNLASFKVPFISYLTMSILVISSAAFYWIPYNYLMMSLGIYKFTRKFLNPDRILNNDLLDFISRVPDNNILKEWKELSVPEPALSRYSSSCNGN